MIGHDEKCVREQPDPDMGGALGAISLGLTCRTIDMKRFFLLGVAGLGLVALALTGSKADEGSRVYIGPADQRPYYYREDYPRYRYYRHADEYRWRRWHQWRHRYYYDPDPVGTTISIDKPSAKFWGPVFSLRLRFVGKMA
jgi:hypothetical protein